MLGISNGKLSRVNTYSDSTSPGGSVVAQQGALMLFIELSTSSQSQRAGRNRLTCEKAFVQLKHKRLLFYA
jgi:hypothetical protein